MASAVAPRQRSNSVRDALERIETDSAHHLAGPFVDASPIDTRPSTPTRSSLTRERSRRKGPLVVLPNPVVSTTTLWSDIVTLNWTKVPSSALKLLCIPIVLWLNWQLFTPGTANPFKYMLFIQYRVGDSEKGSTLYRKGYGDIAFLAYYVVVFSFLRQFLTLHIFRPLALQFGIRKERTVDRFAEQGYAIFYFTISGTLGLLAMYSSDSWYYKGETFFNSYPYWRMTGFMKTYYLLQFSYWLHQFLVLVLRLEKPRKDFQELVAHHIVTLWLIGWSYLVNLTPIGNAVFITMDISDAVFASAKLLNYLQMEMVGNIVFGIFVLVWTYMRHYLNLCILYSVYYDFDLIPQWAQRWSPEEGIWMVSWVRWQIFVPLFLLQLLNIFWYVLILRIGYRALTKKELTDERSDDEDDGEVDDEKED
ncbi:hypothetical protein FRB96_000119 [Tulasnella sp. 330]|nr:hypothetical protein FRB96_000119 [Tulasnella sp. 330]KAG8882936.1 hypothetical protein FRB97_007532 [Tulasnella sp. 331]